MWGWLTNDWSDCWVRHWHPGNTEWQFVCVWSMVHSLGTEREQGLRRLSNLFVNQTALERHPMKSIKTNLARAAQLRAPWTLSPWWINDGFSKLWWFELIAEYYFHDLVCHSLLCVEKRSQWGIAQHQVHTGWSDFKNCVFCSISFALTK